MIEASTGILLAPSAIRHWLDKLSIQTARGTHTRLFVINDIELLILITRLRKNGFGITAIDRMLKSKEVIGETIEVLQKLIER
jgi:DNA-binding transcriptional MerR regulator